MRSWIPLFASILLSAAASASHPPVEGVEVYLYPCNATLESGANLAFAAVVTNRGFGPRTVNLSVSETNRLLDVEYAETFDLPVNSSRQSSVTLNASTPGEYQLSAQASTGSAAGGTTATVTVLPDLDGTARALGGCAVDVHYVQAIGENATVTFAYASTGGPLTYAVTRENDTVSVGELAGDTSIGTTSVHVPGLREEGLQTFEITLASRDEPNVKVAFTAVVVQGPVPVVGPGLRAEIEPSVLFAAGALAGAGTLALLAPMLRRRFWPAWLLAPLFSRFDRSETLGHPTRQRILAIAKERPGLTVSELAAALNSYVGAVAYHLRVLERNKYVRTRRERAGRRIFPSGEAIPPPSTLTGAQRKIIEALQETPRTALELAALLGVSRQGAHYHLRQLEREGHVRARLQGDGRLQYVPSIDNTPVRAQPPAVAP